MFYKECKFLASHTLLKLLEKEKRIYLRNGDIQMYRPSYLWTNLQDLKQKQSWFSIDTLKDSAWMLKDMGYINILKNENHIYDIQLGILDKGLTAFKEKEFIWLFLKSWRTLVVSLPITIAAIIYLIKGLKYILSQFR